MDRQDAHYDFSSLNRSFDSYHRAGSSWAGKDAFKVPKTRIVDGDSEGEQFDFTGVNLTQCNPPGNGKGKERERMPDAKAGDRPAKRRKVGHDVDFLDADLPHALQPSNASSASTSAFAVPSSDLLKCIHHFACNYYSDRGQLFNDSRIYRKARKQRRLAKLARKQQLEQEDPDSGQEQLEQEHANSGQEEGQVHPDPQKAKNGQANRRRDMYKTLDGSALLAVGMLLQEHVARILTSNIPEGWDQSMMDGEYESEDAEDEDDETGEEEEEELDKKVDIEDFDDG
ncbi:hypothetical protein DFH07DRAFT_954930 [Mycena maculata]|uniref:Uncharacterized protein n=1 Tax=Mycena maculata TaxID=230809 RepID=A0AAD7JLH4_9AGAR|nr:hypothetical protein DFH07DRAFT_954930 [Mycena maculata]